MLTKRFEDRDFSLQYCGITGITSMKLPSIAEFFVFLKEIQGDLIVQCFDSTRIASWEHVFFAAYNAIWSYNQSNKFSQDQGIEFLLFLSGQRQIKIAKERYGIRDSTEEMGLVLLGNNPKQFSQVAERIMTYVDGKENDSILELGENKIELIMTGFKITDGELHAICPKGSHVEEQDALVKLVLNRITMLMLEK